MTKFLYLALGSLLGGFARYFLAGAIYESFGGVFPLGTLVVNLLGCFLIGFLSVLAGGKFFLDDNSRLLLMTGFCGAFTTFSSFVFQTDNLLKDGEMMKAALNVVLSVVAGFIVFRLGVFLGKMV